MSIKVRPDGPIPARIMLVGEAPGFDEEREGRPFVGASGQELNRMLAEAGVNRSECFVTNVCRERPFNNDISTLIATKKKDITKEHSFYRGRYVKRPILEGCELLAKEIVQVNPNVVIALGNTPLWALTGEWGILKWRGSMLYIKGRDGNSTQVKCIPTVHPAAVLRQWDLRAISVRDLKRAAVYRDGRDYPKADWKFIVRPSYKVVNDTLDLLYSRAKTEALRLSFDLETRGGHIACAGISWSLTEALCIPFMCVENEKGYWNETDEAAIVWKLRALLTHPNVQVIGQNLLFDCQYTFRHWLFVPRVAQDTMISQHTAFAGLKKSLDFQASMYCENYRYWKDDGKHWDKSMGEDQLWVYNCEDCVRTDEVAHVHDRVISSYQLQDVEKFQQELFWPVLRAMQIGVRIDLKAREEMRQQLAAELHAREDWFKAVLGHPLNPRSPKQMMTLFYEDLKMPVIMTRAKKGIPGRPTLDDEALEKLATKEPLLRPLLRKIAEYRSLGVFSSTFVEAELDTDDRMRCSYNICGAETYRFSSSSNPFDCGTNLQNIPKGVEAKEADDLELPNIRRLFIPDEGYTFFDMDLDRADLQVVVWEADDADLKEKLRKGVDLHAENAKDLGLTGPAGRQLAKIWVHGTNYGGSPRTMAANCGITVHTAEKLKVRWFQIHPGIGEWHRRTEAQLRSKHQVSNAFGYRRHYFDRVEGLLSEALAWIPQSTVACVINRAWVRIFNELPDVQVLLQVHDSLAGQFQTADIGRLLPEMRRLSSIVVPYEDPLIIPTHIKTSPISWGDCE